MDTRIGRQSPTVSVILPYTDTVGQEAIDLYNGAGNLERPAKNGVSFNKNAAEEIDV